ncbi:hypothetical protein KF728_14400 [Candidatus Obscuribacterales bacterium]|nr:hypothetical protein [Candidatus Obscuribacterales bacterium]MBX3151339.1 hypothetical protein [Candidatus Obscuribacterales bacterium]
MLKPSIFTLSVVALAALIYVEPAFAQAASQARTGTFGNTSTTTNNFRRANAQFTRNQRLPQVRPTGLGGLAQIHGRTGRNGLPVTSLDSFVLNAGGAADQIYGDEGTEGPPPFEEFTAGHRIQAGIQGNASGLTTGHGSYLPCAWGGDEYVDGPEFSQSAPRGGNNYWASQPQTGANPGTQSTDTQNNDSENYRDYVAPDQYYMSDTDNSLYQQVYGQ